MRVIFCCDFSQFKIVCVCHVTEKKTLKNIIPLTLPTTEGGGGGHIVLIFCDFSSNFITEMWVENFFSSGKKFGHTGLFVGGHRQIPVFLEIWKVKKIGN